MLRRLAGAGAAAVGTSVVLDRSVAEAQVQQRGPITHVVLPRENTIEALNQQVQATDAAGGGVILVSGDGEQELFEWQHQLVIPGGVQVVFTADVQFFVSTWLGDLPANQEGQPDYPIRFEPGARGASVTGGWINLARQLRAVDSNGVRRGGAAVFVAAGATGVSVDSLTVNNYDPTLSELDPVVDSLPPDGVRAEGPLFLAVTNCSFRSVHIAVNLRDCDTADIRGNNFARLLDSSVASNEESSGEAANQIAFGGAFVQMVGECSNVLISDNRSVSGAFQSDHVGGSLVVTSPNLLKVEAVTGDNPPVQDELRKESDPAHRNIVVSANDFRGNGEPSRVGIANGAVGDMIALKNVLGFKIQDNILRLGGEFGIVVTHGSAHGVVTGNDIRAMDGSGIVIGGHNVPKDGFQGSPEVFDITVEDNIVWGCGLDKANELRRYGATPRNALRNNYPNAVSSIRIWNARDIRVVSNCVMEYRSSGIWVPYTFDGKIDRSHNAVTQLTIESSNVLEPYRTGDPYADEVAAPLDDSQPYTGISLVAVPDDSGVQVIPTDRDFVRGFDASRYVGPALDEGAPNFITIPSDWPWLVGADTPEAVVIASCPSGVGRIDVYLANTDCVEHEYSVRFNEPRRDDDDPHIQGPGEPEPGETEKPKVGTLLPGQESVVTRTGRYDGVYVITVLRDGEVIENPDDPLFENPKTVIVACEAVPDP